MTVNFDLPCHLNVT